MKFEWRMKSHVCLKTYKVSTRYSPSSRIYAILKARSSIVRSVGSLSWCAAAATKLSYPTIDLGACWTRHFEWGEEGFRSPSPFSLFTHEYRSGSRIAAAAAATSTIGTHLHHGARLEIIVSCNARTTSEPPHFQARLLRIRRASSIRVVDNVANVGKKNRYRGIIKTYDCDLSLPQVSY